MELKPGMARGSGHSSRVFSVKFHPDDPNIIVSGGWVRALPFYGSETPSAAEAQKTNYGSFIYIYTPRMKHTAREPPLLGGSTTCVPLSRRCFMSRSETK